MLNLNFNFNGKTFLRQWWPMVKSLFRQVQTAINGHASNETLDHPDLSVKTAKIDDLAVTNGKIAPGAVTGDKIPDQEIDWNHLKMYAVIEDAIHNGAVTKAKLGADVIGELSDLEAVVSKEYNLSEMPAFGGTDRYTAADIPLNKLVKITNDTDTDLTFFQDHDEYGTALSSPIPARSSRIIIKVKNPVGGAEVENGYCIVLDGLATKQDVTNLARFVTSNQTAIATINGNDTVTGSTDKKIKDAINAFATQLTNDGTVNTYKEALDWIAAHGSDYTALLGQVSANEGNIAQNTEDISELETDFAEETSVRRTTDTWLDERLTSAEDLVQRVYDILGVVYVDGGTFGQGYARTYDAGAFTDEPTATYDCGTFEPIDIFENVVIHGGTF